VSTLPVLIAAYTLLGAPQQPVAPSTPAPTVPAPDLREIRARVVKIETADEEKGAGLVLGTDGKAHITIVTALHVVRQQSAGTDEPGASRCPAAAPMTITFPDRRDTFDGASLVACLPDVDVALLELNSPSLVSVFNELPKLCWQTPREQERVSVIGHAGDDWTTSSVDIVLGLGFDGDSRRFRLTGQGSNKGASGGPVLNDAPCLLGIFTNHAVNDSRATKTEVFVTLAEANALSTGLVGGTTPIDRQVRTRIFEDVSTTLNGYLFQLEGVHEVFQREYLTRTEFAQVINAYNDAFNHWYQRRDSLSQDVLAQWGAARSQDFDGVTRTLYELHNRLVYTKLGDMVNRLTASKGAVKIGDLKPNERKALDDALASLQMQLANARPLVTGLLDRMKPLLSAGQ